MGEDDIDLGAGGRQLDLEESEVEGTAPANRTDAASLPSATIIIFGGKTEEGDTLNDVHVLKKTENVLEWSAITDVSAERTRDANGQASTPPKEAKPGRRTSRRPRRGQARGRGGQAEDAAKEEDAGGEKEEGTAEEGAEEKEEAEAAEGEAKESAEGADESEPA